MMNNRDQQTKRKLLFVVARLRAAARVVHTGRHGGLLPAGSRTRPLDMSTRLRRSLLFLLLLGLIGSTTGAATFSAFSSTTSNDNNTYAAGTVLLTDNDAAAAMYIVAGRKPGDTFQRCIKLTYTGTLPADVKLYTLSSLNALATYIDLTVERGTAVSAGFGTGDTTVANCTGFTPTVVAQIYSGTLANFSTTKNSYANGILAFPGAQTSWVTNDTMWYRFTLTLQDNNLANGGATPLTTGTTAYTWEARNQ